MTQTADTAKKDEYQVFTSPKLSFRMMTPKGRRIYFIAGKCITKVKEEIEYLDSEIEAGIRFITKGEAITSEDLDPMVALRKRIIKEYEAEKAASAKVPEAPADKVAATGAPAVASLGALNSSVLAKIATESNANK